MADVQWLHSGGKNNKNPNLDIGGPQSNFSIASNTINNLFDDVTPEEEVSGLIDYRCIYIRNPWVNLYLTNPVLSLSGQATGGSDITFGTLLNNDTQRFTFLGGNPDSSGYIIVSCEFGTFKVDYGGSFAVMAANFQSQLQTLPYCSGCTATLNAGFPPTIDIVFDGDCSYRETSLMIIEVNRLQSTQGSDFIIASYIPSDTFNGTGDTQIKVTDPIDSDTYGQQGKIYVFNPATDTYVAFNYTNLSLPYIFNLSSPLTFNLLAYDHLYVTVPDAEFTIDNYLPLDPYNNTGDTQVKIQEVLVAGQLPTTGFLRVLNPLTSTYISFHYDSITLPSIFNITTPLIFDLTALGEIFVQSIDDKNYLVKVRKLTQGSPINTTAELIANDQTAPDGVVFDTTDINLGTIFSIESFPVWVKRTTAALVPAKKEDSFTFGMSGTLVNA